MALPTESDLTGISVTNAQMKVALAGLRNFIANLLGTTETVEDARAALGAGTVGDALFTAETEADARAAMPIQSATAVSLSGTSVDFTSIPSWVKRITITVSGLSTSGTSRPMIQLGDSGGVETSSYSGTVAVTTSSSSTTAQFTTGFQIAETVAAATALTGRVTLERHNTSNLWIASSIMASSGGSINQMAGEKTLSATLDRVRITTTNGTDTFDAGTANIHYE